MVKVAICDDDIILTSKLEELIYAQKHPNNLEIDIYFSGLELLRGVKLGECYDLIYLDVEMVGTNGIETAHELRKTDKNVLIIFMTTHINFAPAAFEVNAFRFLPKPIESVQFSDYYEHALREIIKFPKYFRYTFKRENFIVPIEDIMYFESKQRVSYIVTIKNREERCYEKLCNIEKYLQKHNIYFYRINQSLLVNPKYVYSYKYDKMVLTNEEELSVAKNRREKVSKLFAKIRGDDSCV